MKFKKYIKEETIVEETKLTLSEDFGNPDEPMFGVKDMVDNFYKSVKDLIAAEKYTEAAAELDALEADLNEFEATNSKKKFFKFPQFMIDNERKRLQLLRDQLPKNESIEDMDKRCENCNTLLNDQGTCPKCDDGEEDYGDVVTEELSAREKLMKAFPGVFNFDKVEEEPALEEKLSNKEKLKRAYPELNFDDAPVVEGCIDEPVVSEDYDDDYSFEDVQEERAHHALFGGDNYRKDIVYDDDDSCIECDACDTEDEFDDTF